MALPVEAARPIAQVSRQQRPSYLGRQHFWGAAEPPLKCLTV
jgi:hypothetical protein